MPRFAALQLAPALALALAACGRLEFAPLADASGDSAQPDVLALHDEDGDGIPDIMDPCPHLAGDAADADGDGVGDACDPNPNTPTEHFLLFATMQPGDTGFDDISGWDQQADAIHTTMIATQLFVTRNVDIVRIYVGYDVNSILGAGQHQIANGVVNPGEYYFAELNDNSPLQDVGVVSYDSTNGYVTVAQAASGAAEVGPGVLRTDVLDGAAPMFVVDGGWNNASITAMGPTPGYLPGTAIRIGFNGIEVTIRYLVIIASS